MHTYAAILSIQSFLPVVGEVHFIVLDPEVRLLVQQGSFTRNHGGSQ